MSDEDNGSSSRPFFIKYEELSSNWGRIFSKEKIAQDREPVAGDIRINSQGQTEVFSQGYWKSDSYDNK